MAIGKGLALKLRLVVDDDSIAKVEDSLKGISSTAASVFTARAKDAGIGSSPSVTQNIAQNAGAAQESKETKEGAKALKDVLFGMATGAVSSDEEVQKQTKILTLGQEVMSSGIKGLTSITKGSFDFLEQIYNYLKQASPLLQTIEQLFNLAVTLFFMPLGNKLAEVLLPAVLNLVDNVVSMWEAMEGMSLSEMITLMMETGVTYFAQFFQDIGSLLTEQGGLLGALGNIMTAIGDFIENNAYGVLNLILNSIAFIMDHLKEIISLIAAFYAMQYAMQVASMYVNAVGDTIAGKYLGAGVLAAGVATAGLSYFALDRLGMAEGGYVPATEGGQLRILGEGGQGEYVIPEDKVGSLGGTTYIYNTFNGYTDDDVIRMIRDEVSSQISLSRLKGGFRWQPQGSCT